MTEKFKREPRYVVLKIKDMQKYLNQADIDCVYNIGYKIARGRTVDGKPPFNAVVVEQDWPEFDPVWAMIEARMTSGHVFCRPAWQERVIAEKAELDARLAKLNDFQNSEQWSGLDVYNRRLLTAQYHLMKCLSNVLAERIAAFGL